MQDIESDPHCALLATRIDDHARALGHVLERTLLDAKADVERNCNERWANEKEDHAQAQAALQAKMDATAMRATQFEISLERSFEQSSRLAQRLASVRLEAQQTRQQARILASWTASAAASREYGVASVSAWGHHRRRIMRNVVCGWRTVARLSRHEAIDTFWGTWPHAEPLGPNRPQPAPTGPNRPA